VAIFVWYREHYAACAAPKLALPTPSRDPERQLSVYSAVTTMIKLGANPGDPALLTAKAASNPSETLAGPVHAIGALDGASQRSARPGALLAVVVAVVGFAHRDGDSRRNGEEPHSSARWKLNRFGGLRRQPRPENLLLSPRWTRIAAASASVMTKVPKAWWRDPRPTSSHLLSSTACDRSAPHGLLLTCCLA
jgi:hypothetical protein